MNKKVAQAVLDEIDAVLSSPITAKGLDEAMLLQPETREEIVRLVQNYLNEAPEPTSLVHTRRR